MAFFTREQTDAFLRGEWVSVSSSTVAEAAWDDENQILHVVFQGKLGQPSTYRYRPVGPGMARDFAAAQSKGKWIDRNLKKAGVSYTGPESKESSAWPSKVTPWPTGVPVEKPKEENLWEDNDPDFASTDEEVEG